MIGLLALPAVPHEPVPTFAAFRLAAVRIWIGATARLARLLTAAAAGGKLSIVVRPRGTTAATIRLHRLLTISHVRLQTLHSLTNTTSGRGPVPKAALG